MIMVKDTSKRQQTSYLIVCMLLMLLSRFFYIEKRWKGWDTVHFKLPGWWTVNSMTGRKYEIIDDSFTEIFQNFVSLSWTFQRTDASIKITWNVNIFSIFFIPFQIWFLAWKSQYFRSSGTTNLYSRHNAKIMMWKS